MKKKSLFKRVSGVLTGVFSVLHLSWLPMKTDNYSEVRH